MPNSSSARKRLRQSKVRRASNRSAKSALKTHVKKVLTAAESGDVDSAEKLYIEAARKLDKASSGNIIHQNSAARRKSRMQRKILAAKNSS